MWRTRVSSRSQHSFSIIAPRMHRVRVLRRSRFYSPASRSRVYVWPAFRQAAWMISLCPRVLDSSSALPPGKFKHLSRLRGTGRRNTLRVMSGAVKILLLHNRSKSVSSVCILQWERCSHYWLTHVALLFFSIFR